MADDSFFGNGGRVIALRELVERKLSSTQSHAFTWCIWDLWTRDILQTLSRGGKVQRTKRKQGKGQMSNCWNWCAKKADVQTPQVQQDSVITAQPQGGNSSLSIDQNPPSVLLRMEVREEERKHRQQQQQKDKTSNPTE